MKYEGEGDGGVCDRDGRCERVRAADDEPVRRIEQDDPEVVEVPNLFDLRREIVDLPESGDEEQHKRREIDDDEPAEWRQQQEKGAQPRPSPKQGLKRGGGPARFAGPPCCFY